MSSRSSRRLAPPPPIAALFLTAIMCPATPAAAVSTVERSISIGEASDLELSLR